MVTTTLTLLMREISVNASQMVKGLPLQQRVAVDSYPHGGADGLVNDARIAAIRDLMLEAGGPVRTPAAFQKLKDTVKPQVPGRVRQAVVAIAPDSPNTPTCERNLLIGTVQQSMTCAHNWISSFPETPSLSMECPICAIYRDISKPCAFA